MKKLFLFSLGLFAFLASCSDDDDNGGMDPDMGTDSVEFTVKIENTGQAFEYVASGVINTPVDSANAGPIMPDSKYKFSFYAGPQVLPGATTKLSFALMLIKSNDLFFAPAQGGIPLYDETTGEPLEGDITDKVLLWDAGTEVNQSPENGTGQPLGDKDGMTDDSGNAEENGNVIIIEDGAEVTGDGFSYPAVSDLIKVEIKLKAPTLFEVTIKNVSGSSALPGPHSPGVWAVHTQDAPLFTTNSADRGEGLEAIAEDGNPAMLGSFLAERSGVIVPLSPGAWAVHANGSNPMFTAGQPDTKGIEGIAEDGVPTDLVASLAADEEVRSSAAFNTPVGADMPGAIGPGGSYEFKIKAVPGDYFNFATMYVQSNDLFYAFGSGGIALWENNAPISGEVDGVSLWDAGTELNEFPGAGLNQVIRQSTLDAGEEDSDNTVRLENDEFEYQRGVVRVTITPGN